jgi:hypothetical protein
MKYFSTPPPLILPAEHKQKHINTCMKHRRGKWMECAVTSIGVTVVSVTISHKSLAAAHVTYAHVHVITPGISWHRITILPYRLLHMYRHYLRRVFGCMYAGKTTMQQPCHNSLQNILYSIQSCNHDLYDLRPYDFSLAPYFHDQHNKSIR